MKKSITLMAVCLGLLLGLEACKKGENDPFFSTKSRKARITGEWELSSGESSNADEDGVYAKSVIENETKTEIYELDTVVYGYHYLITFNKDGSFERTITEEYDEYTRENVTKGIWSFLDKNERLDLASKEAITLEVKESFTTSTTTDGDLIATQEIELDESLTTIIHLNRLSNKEMVFKSTEKFNYEGDEESIYFSTQTFKKL